MGGGGAAVRLSPALPQLPSTFQCSAPYAFLQPHFHQGCCSGGGHLSPHGQGCCGACSSPFSGLLQPSVRRVEDLGVLASSRRPLPSQSLCGRVSLSDGDHSVCAPVGTSGGLDGLHRSQGSLSAGADPSFLSSPSTLRLPRPGVPVQGSLLRPFHSYAGLHQGHGSCFRHSPLYGYPHAAVPRRLARPVFLSGLPCQESSDRPQSLSRVGDRRQSPEIQPCTFPDSAVSGCRDRLNIFQGFSIAGSNLQAAVSVSSCVSHTQSSSQAPGVLGDGAHSGGSTLGPAPVVRGPAPAVAGPSCSSAFPARPPAPALISSSLPGSPSAQASCLATLQRFTRAAGFSSAVAEQSSLARRPSSRALYQHRWSIYRSWCHDHGHSVSRPTLAKVADFLYWLRFIKGLSVSSLRGYRSALSAVFRFHLPSLSSDPVIRDLLRSFRLSSAERVLRPPAWDLSKVLQYLVTSAFEPLSRASFRALTLKTLFLLALATAKRVGELQALSSLVTFVGADACLSYIPQFVAKSESLTRSIPRSFLVKSLADFAAGLDTDLLLCPVRALRLYLPRARSLSPGRHRLFVSPRRPSRAMSKNAVSFFLREVISVAGAARPHVGSLRAHDVRSVSTSVAFHRNWSVSSVLESATWASSSVFSSFYLRDIQHEFDGLLSLGPFVAAGTRIG